MKVKKPRKSKNSGIGKAVSGWAKSIGGAGKKFDADRKRRANKIKW